jgi:hypothetical protein
VGGDGGGIAVSSASAVILECRIWENTADFGGGLSFLSALRVKVNDTKIEANRAVMIGGGIHSSSSDFSITGSEIDANASDWEAGAVYLYESRGAIEGSQITNNSSQGQTGGVRVYGSLLEMSGGQVAGNGVGLYVEGTPAQNVDARHNWWGDDTGPYHEAENPGGLGDAVSDYVDFVPWSQVASVPAARDRAAALRCYPNPFRDATIVQVYLGGRSTVRLQAYDAAGRCIATLLDTVIGPGRTEVTWDLADPSGRDLSSGIYFLRFSADGATLSYRVSRLH